MKILHISRTPCAGAIEALSSAINDHTEHESAWVGSSDVGSLSFNSPDLSWCHTGVYPLLYDADVLVLHNYIGVQEQPIRDFLDGMPEKRVVGFFHSHPDHCNMTLAKAGYPIFVPAQFQALLHPGSIPARQVIRFDRADWPKWQPAENGAVRIGYAPTVHIPQSGEKPAATWYDSKGYPETIKILEEVEAASDRVELVIIDGVRYDMAIRLKARCDIFIDEVVTGSYHRNTLEAMAMGVPAVCQLDPEILSVVAGVTGSCNFPILYSTLETLKGDLLAYADRPEADRLRLGEKAKAWMGRYWAPGDIARGFCETIEGVSEVTDG